MPPNTTKTTGDPGNDDYVAQVLAREARDSSLKYSAHGLAAYMPKRPTGAAPKPNTRFLRHIIKETDNHNTALKRKEEREARERMRQLRAQTSSSSHDARREQRRSHRTSDDRESRCESRRDRDDKSSSHRRRHTGRSESRERDQSHRSRRRRETDDAHDADRQRYSRKSRRDRSYSRSRSRSPEDDRHADSRRRRRHYRSRYDSASRSRSRSPRASERRKDKDNERRSHRSSREHDSSRRNAETRKERSPPRTALPGNPPSDNESDPLEDLVGPLPAKENGHDYPEPIRSRGRGAYRPNMSNIDAHFAADYDPTADVHLEEDDQASSRPTRRPVQGLMTGDDDWELALEAVRDRARWKQKGEERLREAGFGSEFVERWKSNTTSTPGDDSEGRLEDVKWSKKGEGREWDRGKFFDDDGHIDVKASW
ncbi:hypothetical protein BO71DRAFT_380158 [Aspergillus ellipticus CBS 707.79]|uniref:Uncharacterized protein n=1 Tax=Aspergillus ellipticus CBS 707.79 TaxID=1448320 RepID=A0A319ESW5_9EURO|nr:hypothetical protein BO71DRAFT_380158 [Aspergillus ellipticus CBS 707.79]